MCETRDVLIFLIMLNAGMNVDAIKQLSDHSLVVRCIIRGNAEQFLTQVEIHKRIEDIIAEILSGVCSFKDMECQQTVMQSEVFINPMNSNFYGPISLGFICNVQKSVFGGENDSCTLQRCIT